MNELSVTVTQICICNETITVTFLIKGLLNKEFSYQEDYRLQNFNNDDNLYDFYQRFTDWAKQKIENHILTSLSKNTDEHDSSVPR